MASCEYAKQLKAARKTVSMQGIRKKFTAFRKRSSVSTVAQQVALENAQCSLAEHEEAADADTNADAGPDAQRDEHDVEEKLPLDRRSESFSFPLREAKGLGRQTSAPYDELEPHEALTCHSLTQRNSLSGCHNSHSSSSPSLSDVAQDDVDALALARVARPNSATSKLCSTNNRTVSNACSDETVAMADESRSNLLVTLTPDDAPSRPNALPTVAPVPSGPPTLLMVALPAYTNEQLRDPDNAGDSSSSTCPRSHSQLSTNSSGSNLPVVHSSSQSSIEPTSTHSAAPIPHPTPSTAPTISAPTHAHTPSSASLSSAIASICTATSNTAAFVAGEQSLLLANSLNESGGRTTPRATSPTGNGPQAAQTCAAREFSSLQSLTSTFVSPAPSNSSATQQRAASAVTDGTASLAPASGRAPQTTPKKRRGIFHNAFAASYRSKVVDFRRIFKDTVGQERLLCDYACAFHSDILLQGRMYISLNFVSFYAKILGFETKITLAYKDVLSIVKEKTARLIPNAIRITVSQTQKAYFFTSFTTRDRTFDVLHRLWQNALQNKVISTKEFWYAVHAFNGPNVDLVAADEEHASYLEFLSSDSLEEPLVLCDLLTEQQNQRVLVMKQQNLQNLFSRKAFGIGSDKASKSRASKDDAHSSDSPQNVSPTGLPSNKNGASTKNDSSASNENVSRKSKFTGRTKASRTKSEWTDKSGGKHSVPEFTLVGSDDGNVVRLPTAPSGHSVNSSEDLSVISDEDMHYQDCYSDPEPFCNESSSFVYRVETDDMNTLRPNPLLLHVDGSRGCRSRSGSRKHTLVRAHTMEPSELPLSSESLFDRRPVVSALIADNSKHSSCDELSKKVSTVVPDKRPPSVAGSSTAGNEELYSSEEILMYLNENDDADSDSDAGAEPDANPPSPVDGERSRRESTHSNTVYCLQHEHFDLQILDIPVALPSAYLFDCLTNVDARAYIELYCTKKHKDFVAEPWSSPNTQPSDGETARANVNVMKRIIRYVRTVELPGIKTTSRVTEEYSSYQSEKANPRRGIYYMVNVIRNAGIPYAESFHVEQQYCVRPIDADSSHLIITARQRFNKEVGLMKGLISRSCESAIRDFFKDWPGKLQEEANRFKAERAATVQSTTPEQGTLKKEVRTSKSDRSRRKIRPEGQAFVRRSRRNAPTADGEARSIDLPQNTEPSPTDGPGVDATTIDVHTKVFPAPSDTPPQLIPTEVPTATPAPPKCVERVAPASNDAVPRQASRQSLLPATNKKFGLVTLVYEPFKWLIVAFYAAAVVLGQLMSGFVSKHEIATNRARSRESIASRLFSNMLYSILIMIVMALVFANYTLHSKLEAIEHLLVELRAEIERLHNSGSS